MKMLRLMRIWKTKRQQKEIKDMQVKVEENLDNWHEKLDNINDVMMEKMFAAGISRRLFMMRMAKLKEVKEICMKCVQNKDCVKHAMKEFFCEKEMKKLNKVHDDEHKEDNGPLPPKSKKEETKHHNHHHK